MYEQGLTKRVPTVSSFSGRNEKWITVDFQTSVTGATEPTQYDWWFGDGSHITGKPYETHTYSSPWTYNVVVRVLDWHGCWSQSSVTVLVSATTTLTATTDSGVATSFTIAFVIAGTALLLLIFLRYSTRRSPSQNKQKQITCAHCGWQNTVGNDYCGKCAASLRDQTQVY